MVAEAEEKKLAMEKRLREADARAAAVKAEKVRIAHHIPSHHIT